MTGPQLRNSILQEAIQGRLVPNVLEPGEKTGAELLQDILTAHQQKENTEKGKKAKKLNLSTIEEEPWDLPEGWCWARLGDLVDYSTGLWEGKKPPFVRVGVIRNANFTKKFTLSFDNIAYLDVEERQYSTRKLQFGDIIIEKSGGGENQPVGRPVLFLKNEGEYSYSNFTSMIRIVDKRLVIPTFMQQVLVGFYVSGVTINLQSNTTNLRNLDFKGYLDLAFPLPPISIQRAIVNRIGELMPLVDEYDKAAGELETLNKTLPDKLRKSVLQEAIHGNLVPNDILDGEATASELLQQILKERQEKENKEKGSKAKKLTLSTIEEEPWELPEGWCWARLGDVMTFVNGRAYKKDELLSSGKYKVLRVGNFFTNDSWYYSDLELPEEKYCFKGDLLYAWSASFGPWIWEGDKTIFHYHIWNVKFDESSLYKKYLYWFFEADKHIIKESTTGSTMVHVSMENMMPRLIPIPPLSIQRRIVEKIEEVFATIDELQS